MILNSSHNDNARQIFNFRVTSMKVFLFIFVVSVVIEAKEKGSAGGKGAVFFCEKKYKKVKLQQILFLFRIETLNLTI